MNGALSLGAFFSFNLYLADADHAAAHARHVDRPGASARSPPASASSRCSTSREEIADAAGAARAAGRAPGASRFEDVTFGYDPERPVLPDIDLEVAPGRRSR